MMGRVGRVKLCGELVGVIEESEPQISFTYAPGWLGRPDAVPVAG